MFSATAAQPPIPVPVSDPPSGNERPSVEETANAYLKGGAPCEAVDPLTVGSAQQDGEVPSAPPMLTPICWARPTAPNRRQKGRIGGAKKFEVLDICWARARSHRTRRKKDLRLVVASPFFTRGSEVPKTGLEPALP